MVVEREVQRLELEQDPRAHEEVRCLLFLLFFVFVCLWSCAALGSAIPQVAFTRREEEGDGSVVAVAFFFLLFCCAATQ